MVRCGTLVVHGVCSCSVPSTFETRKGEWAGEHYNNSLASRPINANSNQCSSSARRVRLLYSRGCARPLTTDDWALRLPPMHVHVHL